MTGDAKNRLEQLFASALKLPTDQREEFAERECADDEALLNELMGLLRHDQLAANAKFLHSDYTMPPSADRDTVQPTDVSTEDNSITCEPIGPSWKFDPESRRIGHYELIEPLGKGGFGTVWLAEDSKLQRRVAIKLASARRFPSRQQLAMLIREARSAGQFDGRRGLVTVHDIIPLETIADSTADPSDAPVCAIVMEYVQGHTLAEVMKSGKVPHNEAAEIIAKVADALVEPHRRGIVHRDLKPGNILLDPQKQPVIVDFGLAVREQSLRLRSNELCGTPAYMSPEQIRGDKLDGRSDIWSLGVILYEMLTGRRPFEGGTFQQTLDEITTHEPKPPRQLDDGIPRELERICLGCLSKSVADRYLCATDLAKDLRRSQRPSRRRRAFSIVIAIVAILLISTASAWFAATLREPAPEPLSGNIDVRIWNDTSDQRSNLSLKDAGALPLRLNDQIRIEAELSRPAYMYIAWIDTEGDVKPVYPRSNGGWGQQKEPRSLLSLPENLPHGYRIKKSSNGTETVILLARDTPLPDTDELQTILSDLPPIPVLHPGSTVFDRRKTVPCFPGQPRAPDFESEPINDTHLNTHHKIGKLLGENFPFFSGVAFSVSSQPGIPLQKRNPAAPKKPVTQGGQSTKRSDRHALLAGYSEYPNTTPSRKSNERERQELLAERDRLANEMSKHQAHGQIAEAIATLEKTLAVQRRLFEPTHDEILYSYSWLSLLYAYQGGFKQARRTAQTALSAVKKRFGEGHSKTTNARLHLANVEKVAALPAEQRRRLGEAEQSYWEAERLCVGGDFEQALVRLQAVTNTWTEFFGAQHHRVALAIHLSAECFLGLKQFSRAERLCRQARDTYKATLGENRSNYADTLGTLGFLCELTDRLDEAETYYRDAVAAYQRVGFSASKFWLVLDNFCHLLSYRAARCEQHERFDDAIRVREEIVQTLTSLYGRDHWHVTDAGLMVEHTRLLSRLSDEERKRLADAARLTREVDSSFGAGRYLDAVPLAQQAIQIRKELLGDQHPDYAMSLSTLANLCSEMGDYGKAEPLLEHALAINKRALGEHHPGYAATLQDLGNLHLTTGDYGKAEPLLKQAVEITKEAVGEHDPNYATTLVNLARLYHVMSDFGKAQPLFQRALEIQKKLSGKDRLMYANTLHNLAAMLLTMGDYAKAKPLNNEAMEIRKSLLGEEHREYAESLFNLALLSDAIGEHDEAVRLCWKVLDIQAAVLGQDSKIGEKNYPTLDHPDMCPTLNGIAGLFFTVGKYADAEYLYQRVWDIQTKSLGEEHPYCAITVNNLAAVHESMGNYDEAKLLLQYAMEITKEALGEEHMDYAFSLKSLARLHHTTNEYGKAESLLQQALTITRNVLESAAQVQSERQQLAMAQMLRYRLDVYVSLVQRMENQDKLAFEQVLQWKGATLVRQRAYRLVANEPAVASLFRDLQQKTMRLASLARAVPDKPAEVPGWKHRLADLTAQKEQLEVEMSRKSSTFRESQREITIADVASALPDGAVLVDFLEYKRWAPPAKPGDEWTSQPSLVAFVLRPDQSVRMLDLGACRPVTDAIGTWRLTFGMSAKGMAASRQLRERLWEPLMPSIGEATLVLVSPDGNLGRLPLGALPGKESGTYLLEDHRLAVLPVPRLLPTLISTQGRKRVEKRLLLLGDVDYDAEPTQEPAPNEWRKNNSRRGSDSLQVADVRGQAHFRPLTATADEIELIETQFREVFEPGSDEIVTLKRAAATEARFRDLAPKSRHLHLATHGFFAPPEKESALSVQVTHNGHRLHRGHVYPGREQYVVGYSPLLLSGLVLAGANRPPTKDRDDGILTAEEIAFSPLNGAELVTLSACQTGLGTGAGGEGLLGVQRAFQVSGAQTTVATLWKVNDWVTMRLMEQFYRNLWEKEMPRLDALREAQLWVLNMSRPGAIRETQTDGGSLELLDENKPAENGRLSPYYWGAFVLSGDWR